MLTQAFITALEYYLFFSDCKMIVSCYHSFSFSVEYIMTKRMLLQYPPELEKRYTVKETIGSGKSDLTFPTVYSVYRVRNFRGRVSHFNQSEARKQCFLASDWLKYETLPRKFRTL